jgi:hypothetical protein
LRAYAGECRRIQPWPARSALSTLAEWQGQVLGGTLIGWLKREFPEVMNVRSVLAKKAGFIPRPEIVILSNEPGLVAAVEILGEKPSSFVTLTPDQYALWSGAMCEDRLCWCIEFSSLLVTPSRSAVKRFRKEYPVPRGSVYWIHAETTDYGRLAGVGGLYLWA